MSKYNIYIFTIWNNTNIEIYIWISYEIFIIKVYSFNIIIMNF